MKNSFKLFVIFFILILIIIILPSKKHTEVKNEYKQEQIISLPEPNIVKIIVYTHEGKIELVKENEKYKIVSKGYFAGPQEFSMFLGDINSIEGYKIKEIKDLKEGKIFIEAYLKNDIYKYVKIVGKSHFGKSSYFLEANGMYYQVEAEKIDKILNFKVKKIRNHLITDFVSDDIKDFWIDDICFSKNEEGKWTIKDYREEIDDNKVFSAFAMATGLRAKEFTESREITKYGLDKPIHKLVINKNDKSKIIIVFSKKDNKYYGYSEVVKEVFEVHQTDWDILEKKREYYKKDKKEVDEGENKDKETK